MVPTVLLGKSAPIRCVHFAGDVALRSSFGDSPSVKVPKYPLMLSQDGELSDEEKYCLLTTSRVQAPTTTLGRTRQGAFLLSKAPNA
jgi:hypothetical protein